MQLRAENASRSEDAEVDLCNAHHAKKRGSEVEPRGGPDVCKDSRSGGASGVNAKARHRREEENVKRDEDSDQVAGAVGQ